ncbi:conjugal transfer protein TraD [Paeniroseomonas aquatica]|uniref:conjugal transfer protein TraD n=1 Tax=Paeniroseomonas aquatica TaxID=373043 RepID=UPI0036163767
MARKPRDYDAELQALMERAKKLKSQKTTRIGELVQVTGADTLPIEALAGVLLAAVEQDKKQPEAVARWTERGEALFRAGKRDGGKAGSGGDAAGAAPAGPSTPKAGGGA